MNKIRDRIYYSGAKYIAIAIILAGAGLVVKGQQSANVVSASTQVTSEATSRYRVGPGDVLDIRMFTHPEL